MQITAELLKARGFEFDGEDWHIEVPDDSPCHWPTHISIGHDGDNFRPSLVQNSPELGIFVIFLDMLRTFEDIQRFCDALHVPSPEGSNG